MMKRNVIVICVLLLVSGFSISDDNFKNISLESAFFDCDGRSLIFSSDKILPTGVEHFSVQLSKLQLDNFKDTVMSVSFTSQNADVDVSIKKDTVTMSVVSKKMIDSVTTFSTTRSIVVPKGDLLGVSVEGTNLSVLEYQMLLGVFFDLSFSMKSFLLSNDVVYFDMTDLERSIHDGSYLLFYDGMSSKPWMIQITTCGNALSITLPTSDRYAVDSWLVGEGSFLNIKYVWLQGKDIYFVLNRGWQDVVYKNGKATKLQVPQMPDVKEEEPFFDGKNRLVKKVFVL